MGTIGWFSAVVGYRMKNLQANLSFVSYASCSALTIIYQSWIFLGLGYLVGLILRVIFDKTADIEMQRRKKKAEVQQ